MKSILLLTALLVSSHIGLALDEQKTSALTINGYSDENGLIIPMIGTGMSSGFKATGLSINPDYKTSANALWRIELRNFGSKDPIFIREEKNVKSDTFAITSLAISF